MSPGSLLWAMLSGKVVIVAGGGRGLGQAAARNLARNGATVVVNDLGTGLDGEGASEEPARTTAEDIRADDGDAIAHFGDIASFDYTAELVDEVLEEHGRIDGAVNFAGIRREGPSFGMDERDWDLVIRAHLRGHFALYRNLVGHWVTRSERRGLDDQRSFLCVSSATAFGLTVPEVNYGAANAGILGLMWTGDLEVEDENVRVNALMPGGFTRFYEDLSAEERPFQPEDMPPEKVAPVVSFLMSDAADGISGEMIRSENDLVGRVAPPDYGHAVAYREGGWTAETLADRYRETIGTDGL